MQVNPTLYPYDTTQIHHLLSMASPESAEKIEEACLAEDVSKIESTLRPNTLTAESIETICTVVRLLSKTPKVTLHIRRKYDVTAAATNKKITNSVVIGPVEKSRKVFISLHEKLGSVGVQCESIKKVIMLKFDEDGKLVTSKSAVREVIKLSVPLVNQPANSLACTTRRISLMQKLKDSPYFPKNYGFFTSANKEKIFIYQEQAAYDLLDFSNMAEGIAALPLSNKLSMCRQLLGAAREMKEAGILHRDIKVENILTFIHSDGKVELKLTDLGLACRANDKDSLKEIPGSLPWVAPEMIQHAYFKHPAPTIGLETDMWALGLILYFISENKPLLLQENLFTFLSTKTTLRTAIQTCHLLVKVNRTTDEDATLWDYLDKLQISEEEATDDELLIAVAERMTTLNSNAKILLKKWRVNIAELPKPPQEIKNIKDLAHAMLQENPKDRITIEDAEAAMIGFLTSEI